MPATCIIPHTDSSITQQERNPQLTIRARANLDSSSMDNNRRRKVPRHFVPLISMVQVASQVVLAIITDVKQEEAAYFSIFLK